jgi:hypothetical protein
MTFSHGQTRSARRTVFDVQGSALVNTWHEGNAHGLVIAIDPQTLDRKWTFSVHDVNTSGILTTAGDVLFVVGREGY